MFGVQILWPPFIHLVVWKWEFYLGWRPWNPAPIGIGNEGDLFPGVGRWLKRIGLGNLGVALRPQIPDQVGGKRYRWLVRRGF